ncbi:MAG: flagellar hook-basal body complex protein [Anaerolineales bacterium]|nr:flagellar hook-basal body complex protein [Anaerolineales bacterium]
MAYCSFGLGFSTTGIDVVANNIANINTTGYKYNRPEFHELLNAQLNPPQAGDNRTSGQAAGTLLAATQSIFAQGQIQMTEHEWDMAIEGGGLFPNTASRWLHSLHSGWLFSTGWRRSFDNRRWFPALSNCYPAPRCRRYSGEFQW